MTDETVVGQDAAQIGVAGEDDAEEVERFALEPVGTGPQVGDGLDHRRLIVHTERTQSHAMVVSDAEQLHHHREARGIPFGIAVGGIVDATEIDHHLEAQTRIIAQALADDVMAVGADLDRDLAEGGGQAQDALTESVLKGSNQGFGTHDQRRAMVLVSRILRCNWMMP